MTTTDLLRILVQQEDLLKRKRTRSLARQQWAQVIEVEAQLAFSRALRKAIVETDQAVIKDASL